MREVIEKLLVYTGLNGKQFSEKLGMPSAQIIYDIVSGKTRRISEKLAIKILSAYPEINRVWLLTGEGEMLKNSSAVSGYSPEAKEILHLLEGKGVSEDLANKIVSGFPEIDKRWLETGEGEMLKDPSSSYELIMKLLKQLEQQQRLFEKLLEQQAELISAFAKRQ